MKLEIKCTGLPLTPALRQYVEDKLGRLDKYARQDSLCSLKVELAKTSSHHHKGQIFRAEANITCEGVMVRAEALSEDLYAAIDLLKEEAQRELTGRKGKLKRLARRSARALKNLFRRP